MSINTVPAPVQAKHQELILAKFPEAYRNKLKFYTLQELFYVYKIATFQLGTTRQGDVRNGDVFYSMLKRQLFQWLKDERGINGYPARPIAPAALDKIGRKFFNSWTKFVDGIVEEKADELHIEHLKTLQHIFNKAS